MNDSDTTKIVREAYGKIAQQETGCGCGCGSSCEDEAAEHAKLIGYSTDELSAIPVEANLSLSCGNPTAVAALKEGEVVLDLGSGAGFDCFLAASKVGPTGRIIGVDMTPQMLEKARSIARKDNFINVEFRLGEIENLPVADNFVDAVISNCVINLSADKTRVFSEIVRVLKPGGRIAISDIALKKELPEKVKTCIEAYVGCVAGAMLIDTYKEKAEESGLTDVKITEKEINMCISPDTKDPIAKAILESIEEGQTLDDYVVSAYVEGKKKR
jgi:arsenite methyltransferase